MPLPRTALPVLVALQVVVLLSSVTLAQWSGPAEPPAAAGTAARTDDRMPRWFPGIAVKPQGVAVAPVDQDDRGQVRTRVAGRAVTSTSRRPAATLQARGEQALRSLRYDWRALGYAVRFVPYSRGTLGTTNSRTRLITIYVSHGQSELSLRATIAHELGHALDFRHGNAQRREDYRTIRRLSQTSAWFPCSRCSDLASPAGDFAESFAAWLVGPGDFRGRLRPAPSPSELRQLGRLFTLPPARHAAARMAEPSPSPATGPRTRPGLVVVLPYGEEPSPSPS